ncbi:MAG: LuxR C-terminal-related transcriptional regulator [Solirubrobacterales bacterium]
MQGPPRRLAADLGLSARQAEVLTMVARGMSNIEIANAMSLSQRTVEKHLQRIYRRLGVSNRTEAAARTRRD